MHDPDNWTYTHMVRKAMHRDINLKRSQRRAKKKELKDQDPDTYADLQTDDEFEMDYVNTAWDSDDDPEETDSVQH